MKTNTWLTVGIVVLLLVTFGIVVIPKNTSGSENSSASAREPVALIQHYDYNAA